MAKKDATFKEHQAIQKKKGISVFREWGATRKEEMQRRADHREGAAISLPALTAAELRGETVRLKTGKYIPAGQWKNIRPHNR